MFLEIQKSREKRNRPNFMKQLLANNMKTQSVTLLTVFLKSMGEKIETFPPHLIAETRFKIFELVTQMELSSLKGRNIMGVMAKDILNC